MTRERRLAGRRFPVSSLAAALCFLGATLAGGTAAAQASPWGLPVSEIRVEGNRRSSDEDLLQRIHGERTYSDNTVLRVGEMLTREKVRGVVRDLYSSGYFDDIRVDAAPNADSTGVIVTLTVLERPEVEEVRIEGEDELEEDKIREKVGLDERSIFSIQAARADVEKIRDFYAEEGFFLAQVEWETEARPNDRVVVTYRIDEGEQVSVREIAFTGNESIPEEELLGIMSTSPVTFWSPITDSGRYKEADFERDLTLIKAYYLDQGFLDVEVGPPRVALSPDRRDISITIPIAEGPQYSLRRVAVEEYDEDGAELDFLGGRAAVRELIHVEPGDQFSRTAVGEDLQTLTRYYKEQGYANVNVNPDVQPVRGSTEADLVYRIVRGTPVYIERIEIKGNDKTEDKVIRREIQIAEGDLYNETLIELSKRRIEQLGYFETPIAWSTRSGADERHVIITFEVKEKATGTFQVGVGLSSIENFIATAQIAQENFLGRGQSVTLAAQLSSIRQLFQLQFSDPYFLDSQWLFGVGVYDSMRIYTNYTRQSIGGNLTLGYPLTHDLRVSLGYLLEWVDVSTSGGSTLFGGSSIGALRDLPLANLFNDGYTSAIRASLSYDTRDNRLFPRDGQITGLTVEWASPYLLSDADFTRYTLYTRWYFDLGLGFVFKTNTEFGLVLSPSQDGVPIYERYMPGGIMDVRGFPRFSLGPRLRLPPRLDPNADLIPNGVPVGGNMQLVINIELEYPIVDRLGLRGVFFVDAGNAYNLEDTLCAASDGRASSVFQDPCNHNPFYLRVSAGFGFRWISPLGPLRFEWGFPLWLEPGEETYQFEFMVGNLF
ncbi:MAG: outer membrane protein assembly factor BamA [Deltaproteobacteria bacterium]|nr:outer membrane protein assembly factor BamA [Deltaproteobacteria bacterium]